MDRHELKIFNERTMEVQFLREENRFLRLDRDWLRVEMFHANQINSDLKTQVDGLSDSVATLSQRVAELTEALQEKPAVEEQASAPSSAPPVKAGLPKGRRRKKPGRKAGHAAALRPVPPKIDVHQDVPLPRDEAGRSCCTKCSTWLSDLNVHERIVEDIIPAKVVVTAYHTQSGFCPCCRGRVESRAPEQPPAASLPHGQLGLNALATGVLLRVGYKLPFRQVSGLLADLPGITVSAGAVTRQVQRIAGWLQEDYEQLLLSIRSAPEVYADETGWPTDGVNGYLWTLATPDQTLYHIDGHRGGEVIRTLLGDTFGCGKDQTLVSDFYSAYSTMDCDKQKCLTHLLRELKESAEKSEVFAKGPFFRQAKRLVKQMLLLKKQWDRMSGEQYVSRVIRLETRLAKLAEAGYDEPHAKRLARRMRKHAKELTAFLWKKELEGTNNLAERAIRPMVVARKISGGSRTDNGAEATAKLASLLRTAGQQGRNLLATIKGLLTAAWAAGNPAVVPRAEAAVT